jgi:hypothetical protein
VDAQRVVYPKTVLVKRQVTCFAQQLASVRMDQFRAQIENDDE